MKIRTIAITLSLLAGGIFTVNAQQNRHRYQVGFTAGINYSSIRSDLFTTSSGRPAPALGCSFVVGVSEQIELNQEVVFTLKGAKARAVYFLPEAKPEEHTYAYHYNTFETVLLAGFQPNRNIPVRIQAGVFFGANFHTLNRAQRELMIVDYEDINHAWRAVDLNDAFAGIDYGPAVGLSAGEGRFRAAIRYFWGACNLYKHLDFLTPGHEIRSSSIRLSLTCFLP